MGRLAGGRDGEMMMMEAGGGGGGGGGSKLNMCGTCKKYTLFTHWGLPQN